MVHPSHSVCTRAIAAFLLLVCFDRCRGFSLRLAANRRVQRLLADPNTVFPPAEAYNDGPQAEKETLGTKYSIPLVNGALGLSFQTPSQNGVGTQTYSQPCGPLLDGGRATRLIGARALNGARFRSKEEWKFMHDPRNIKAKNEGQCSIVASLLVAQSTGWYYVGPQGSDWTHYRVLVSVDGCTAYDSQDGRHIVRPFFFVKGVPRLVEAAVASSVERMRDGKDENRHPIRLIPPAAVAPPLGFNHSSLSILQELEEVVIDGRGGINAENKTLVPESEELSILLDTSYYSPWNRTHRLAALLQDRGSPSTNDSDGAEGYCLDHHIARQYAYFGEPSATAGDALPFEATDFRSSAFMAETLELYTVNESVAYQLEQLGHSFGVEQSSHGDTWTTTRRGIGPNACSWPGVMCTSLDHYQPWEYNVSGLSLPSWQDIESGLGIPSIHIDGIYLGAAGLAGTFPDQDSIWTHVQPRYLHVHNNIGLHGSLPASLRLSTRLEELYISDTSMNLTSVPHLPDVHRIQANALKGVMYGAPLPLNAISSFSGAYVFAYQSNGATDPIEDPEMQNHEHLTALYLSGNQLTAIPTAVCTYGRRLTYLNMERNRLHQTPPDCFRSNMTNLRLLYLRYQQCGSPPSGSWSLSTVLVYCIEDRRYLEQESTLLRYDWRFSEENHYFPRLAEVYIEGAQIKDWGGFFAHTPRLTHLHIRFNRASRIPDSFTNDQKILLRSTSNDERLLLDRKTFAFKRNGWQRRVSSLYCLSVFVPCCFIPSLQPGWSISPQTSGGQFQMCSMLKSCSCRRGHASLERFHQ